MLFLLVPEVQNVDVSDASTYDKPVLVQIPANADYRDLVTALEPHGLVRASSADVPERQVVLVPYGKNLERADFLDFVFPSLASLLNLLLSSVFKLPWLILSAFNPDTSTNTSRRALRSLPFDKEPSLEHPGGYPMSYEVDSPPSSVEINRLLSNYPVSDFGDHPPDNIHQRGSFSGDQKSKH